VFALEPVERVSFALSASAVAASFALATPHFATSLAIGAALEALNLRAMLRASNKLFGGQIAGGAPWVGGYSSRFGLLAIAIVAALHFGADPAGLLVGLSLAMPAVVYWAWRNRPPVVDCPDVPVPDPEDPSWDRWSVWRAKEIQPSEDAFGDTPEHADAEDEELLR